MLTRVNVDKNAGRNVILKPVDDTDTEIYDYNKSLNLVKLSCIEGMLSLSVLVLLMPKHVLVQVR